MNALYHFISTITSHHFTPRSTLSMHSTNLSNQFTPPPIYSAIPKLRLQYLPSKSIPSMYSIAFLNQCTPHIYPTKLLDQFMPPNQNHATKSKSCHQFTPLIHSPNRLPQFIQSIYSTNEHHQFTPLIYSINVLHQSSPSVYCYSSLSKKSLECSLTSSSIKLLHLSLPSYMPVTMSNAHFL